MDDKISFVAILSSTVLTDGTFQCETISFPNDLSGVPHYVGHPDTKALIEALGAVQATEKLFDGLEIGESYLAVPLANNKREAGWTVNQAVSDLSQLTAKLVRRVA